jgi:Protein of unknown function (DUF1592)/Protein of unknown function (DUF1588)/Protein of unknown function (DUF1585)
MAHRAVLALMVTIVMAAGAQAQTNPAKPKGTDVSAVFNPIFEMYCTTCHNQTRRTAGLALDSLKTTDVSENSAVWEKVLRRLRTRRDPPIGAPRPEEAVYQSAIATAETALDHAYPTNAVLNNSNRASDTELAGRMAKFIWNGTPDSLLLDAVKKGDLRKPAALEQQVRRMLQDPKADNLVTGFFERWVLRDSLDKAQGADEDLRTALGTETRLFLESQLHEDHNALDLWTANYTFLNDRLARHYGISGISGSEFQKYTFPDNTRAGILGQGSFLTITSFKDRTSPVSRGKVVLTTFLGVPPPDPAPNVPPLKPNDDRPMRVRMQAHLTNPACVNCHATFDPVGFALENFNRLGQWRSTDGGESIDASGAFVDGTKFNGPAELRDGLLKYRAAYYSNITQKLLGYALGHQGRDWPVDDNEMPSVRAVVREAAAHDYRWSSIVLGIVKSTPFQMKAVTQ